MIDKTILKRWIIALASTCQYLVPILAGIHLFVLPSLYPRPFFRESFLADAVARTAIWMYLSTIYIISALGLKNLYRKSIHLFSVKVTKNISSFATVVSSAVIHGTTIYIVILWSFSTFYYQFDKNIAAIISGGNAILYALLVFSQYIFFSEDD